MRPAILIELLERAAQEPIGLCVTTNNPDAMVHRLHIMNRQLEIPDLMICIPSIEGVVFIARKSLELD